MHGTLVCCVMKIHFFKDQHLRILHSTFSEGELEGCEREKEYLTQGEKQRVLERKKESLRERERVFVFERQEETIEEAHTDFKCKGNHKVSMRWEGFWLHIESQAR